MSTAYWVGVGVVAFATVVSVAMPRGEKKPVAPDNWAAGFGRAIALGINLYVLALLVHAARAA